MDIGTRISQEFEEHIQVATACQTLYPDLDAAVACLTRCFEQGHKVLVIGNGGSAADAQHIAAEFTGRFMRERRPLPAIALTTNSSSLTAIANDYGYDKVFLRGLEAFGQVGDVLIGISTSGKSPNIVLAIQRAKHLGLTTIGLTGQGGGDLVDHADICIRVPSRSTPRIQEMHITLIHILCGIVEDAVC